MNTATVLRPKEEYAQKLKDPRWQKLRLEVFERDGWKCRCCGEEMDTLEVHHLVYRNGAHPWEYDLDDLITFCRQCHKYEHQLLTLKKVGIDPAKLEKKLNSMVGNKS